MKKKHLNTLKIASLTLMLGCFAVGGVYNHYQEKQQDHVVKVERKLQPKYASYDDESYTITLTADELNNYTWNNFTQVLVENYVPDNISIDDMLENLSYADDEIFTFIDSNISGNNVYFLYVYGQDNTIRFNEDDFSEGNKFYYSEGDFEYSLTISVGSSFYEEIKSAIELDIQANQPVSQGESIIGAISSGLGLIPDLANEFLTGFRALFWNNQTSSLTTFSYFALVFLGIAITMAIVKLVLAIIRGNTGA